MWRSFALCGIASLFWKLQKQLAFLGHPFPQLSFSINFEKNHHWATLRVISSQTHLVTLLRTRHRLLYIRSPSYDRESQRQRRKNLRHNE
jgi:hypothetical protein